MLITLLQHAVAFKGCRMDSCKVGRMDVRWSGTETLTPSRQGSHMKHDCRVYRAHTRHGAVPNPNHLLRCTFSLCRSCTLCMRSVAISLEEPHCTNASVLPKPLSIVHIAVYYKDKDKHRSSTVHSNASKNRI